MTQDDGERWREQVYERIAAAVRAARRGRSAQDIADATARLGVPITRAQLSNFETGRRQSMDVVDLMVIAAALGIPPVTLLFGGHPDSSIELLPGHVDTSLAGLAWFTGDWELTDTDVTFPGEHAVEQFSWVDAETDEAELLWLIRERRNLRFRAKVMARMAADKRDPDMAYEAAKVAASGEIVDQKIASLIARRTDA